MKKNEEERTGAVTSPSGWRARATSRTVHLKSNKTILAIEQVGYFSVSSFFYNSNLHFQAMGTSLIRRSNHLGSYVCTDADRIDFKVVSSSVDLRENAFVNPTASFLVEC